MISSSPIKKNSKDSIFFSWLFLWFQKKIEFSLLISKLLKKLQV